MSCGLRTAIIVGRSTLAKIVEVAIYVNECAWFPYGDLRQRTSLGSAINVGGCLRTKFPAIFASDSCLLLKLRFAYDDQSPAKIARRLLNAAIIVVGWFALPVVIADRFYLF